MTTETISLEVDADVARIFSTTSPEERHKLELLLNLRLRELTNSPSRPLQVVMNEISHNAELRGLTPETLESLLDNE